MTEREALKRALKALEKHAELGLFAGATITAIKEALANVATNDTSQERVDKTSESVHESVTWGVDWGRAGDSPCVSIIKRLPDGRIEVVAVEYGPPPTWVGLTPQERDEINEQVYGAVPHHVAFHHAIEAKLKEKNCG